MGFFDGLKEHTNDIVMLGTLLCSVMWLMAARQLFSPQIADTVGMVGYLAILFFGIFGSSILIREITVSYPFIEMIVRKSSGSEKYGLFLRRDLERCVNRQIGHNKWACTLPLKFPVTFPGYGKKDEIILHNEGDGQPFSYNRGVAVWNNIIVQHPNVDLIVVSQTDGASVANDRGETIPVFFLENSSKEYVSPNRIGDFKDIDENNLAQLDTDHIIAVTKSLNRDLKSRKRELDEANRQKFEWHQRAINTEEINDQLRVEVEALRESNITFKESVITEVLDLLHITSSIEEALKMARGDQKFSLFTNKYFLLAAVALGILAFFSLNQELTAGIAFWFSNPINQIFALGLVGLFVASIYFVFKFRGKKH